MSGYPHMVGITGPLASHDLAARAKIFRRDQGKVHDDSNYVFNVVTIVVVVIVVVFVVFKTSFYFNS